ncbi:MAG: hypothetical protein E6Q98_14325 [Rhodospirillaceae bacterium]|nr:MAG: hypothetical protein E6Q98_14325 [Rhodospirillaceae bacterium]
MFDKLFLEHPRAVDEGYFEHFCVAAGFGSRMFVASLACLVHAAIPGLFVRTGSTAIRQLHERMVTNRRRKAAPASDMQDLYGLSGDAI